MEQKYRFVRWQTVLRDQLTFLNSLLLTISTGIVGFIISLLANPEFSLICCQKLFFTSGFILAFISVLMGLLTAFSRLLDFRTTVKKIKNEIAGSTQQDLVELKSSMDIYGKATWIFFYLQLISTGLGIMHLMIAFCLIYKDILF